MNISTNISDEQPLFGNASGGYEWWYFDALSSDKKWGVVIIFYLNNPFSPNYIHRLGDSSVSLSDHPAISISLYKKGKTEFYSFLEYESDNFNLNSETGEIKIGGDTFRKSMNDQFLTYDLMIGQELPSGHSLKLSLRFKSNIRQKEKTENESEEGKHSWNLLQPKAKVEGVFSGVGRSGPFEVLFNGDGYHDHNTGMEPMKDSFDDWYWGRFHFEKETLLYYVMNKLDGSQQHEAWLIPDETNTLKKAFTEIRLKNVTGSVFGLKSARKLVLKGSGIIAEIGHNTVIDEGPFYRRYLSDATITKNGLLTEQQGISEYIKPERIYDSKFWWMIHMRLRYMSKNPHWVQKSKFLYERTW